MRKTLASRAFISSLLLSLAPSGCSGGSASPSPPPDPVIVSPNPNNALSVYVTFSAPGASAAFVNSRAGLQLLATPMVSLDADGTGRVAVLGLSPSTGYRHDVEAMTGTKSDTTGSVTSATGPLPAELAGIRMLITPVSGSPQPGYLLVSGVGDDAFAIDETGAVRWYRAFGQPVQESKMQADGAFTTYVGASTGWQPMPGQYVRYAPDGTIAAVYTAAQPDSTDGGVRAVYTDPHEMLLTTDAQGAEHVHVVAYEQRPRAPGATGDKIAWHELVRQSASGAEELRWTSWSRFSAADQIETDLTDDMDHMNAIAIDPTDGNYVVSERNFDALVKIDAQTGAVIWQLGGVQNQFQIVGDPLNGFQGQHSIRVLPNGDLLLFDNGVHRSPLAGRAVEYKLDATAMTATMVWQYQHVPAIATPYVGSVERMQNGNTLVAYCWAGVVDEVDPNGAVVWEGLLLNGATNATCYRVRRVPSLYAYAQP